MQATCETLTASIDDMFGQQRQIKLVLQPNGQYEEVEDAGEWQACCGTGCGLCKQRRNAQDKIETVVQGLWGEEHHVSLVQRPDGSYEEIVDEADQGQL